MKVQPIETRTKTRNTKKLRFFLKRSSFAKISEDHLEVVHRIVTSRSENISPLLEMEILRTKLLRGEICLQPDCNTLAYRQGNKKVL